MIPLLLLCLNLTTIEPTCSKLDLGPVIIAPTEVNSGDDLCGIVIVAEGTVKVEIKAGSKLLWSGKDKEELIFCINVPYDKVSLITIYAEDDLGNTSSHDVFVYP